MGRTPFEGQTRCRSPADAAGRPERGADVACVADGEVGSPGPARAAPSSPGGRRTSTTAAIGTDYLVVGSGAAGMAFADALLSSDAGASIVMVDRRHRPGGHWNDAYAFARLHQPSAFYGVNSLELSRGSRDATGRNQGLYDLAGGAEVLAYFDRVMQQRLLPSGRVRYFPMREVDGDGGFASLASGRRWRVETRRKVVERHPCRHRRAVHPPAALRGGARRALRAAERAAPPRRAAGRLCGGGRGQDRHRRRAVAAGAARRARAHRWIMPRDAWLLDRANVQPGDDFFFSSMGSVARQSEAVAAAESVPDPFDRLEAAGELLRIDPRVRPTVYRRATVTQAELAQLRRVEAVVRLGRVRAVEPGQIVLEHGSVPLPPDSPVVDCSASAIAQRPARPVWDGRRITLQMVRTCQPAFIAHVEAAFADDAQKNGLCAPVPSPDRDIDWLRMLDATLRNRFAWSRHPAIEQWLAQSRLDGFWAGTRRVQPHEADKLAPLQRYRGSVAQVAAKLPQLPAGAA